MLLQLRLGCSLVLSWMHRLGIDLVHMNGLLVQWSLLTPRCRVALRPCRSRVALHLGHRSIRVAITAGGKAQVGTHP